MAFKMVLASIVPVLIKGERTAESGAAERFEFSLICKRLTAKQITDSCEGRSVDEFLHLVVEGWKAVLGPDGQPLEFSQEGLAALLSEPGVSRLAFSAYLRGVEAREKN